MISVPILSKLNHDKDPRYHASFVRAIEVLNKGLAEKKIWNVELNDAKFMLSNAVDRALHVIFDRYLKTRINDYQRAKWEEDISMFCSFNQAAGRIKRLTKKAPKTQIVADYIVVYQEVDSIWKAIQSLKPFIQKGRRPNQNKTEEQIAEELKNTGVCAICANCQKMGDADKMVHHGYKMSEYNHAGYRVGSCFGVGYLPYELSNEANVAYAPLLTNHRKGVKQTITTLKSGEITELEITESEWNHKTHSSDKKKVTVYKTGPTAEKFAQELKFRISRLESELHMVEADIEINDAKIKNWTLQPLKYGR